MVCSDVGRGVETPGSGVNVGRGVLVAVGRVATERPTKASPIEQPKLATVRMTAANRSIATDLMDMASDLMPVSDTGPSGWPRHFTDGS
jgi:hypothetical protein